MTEQSRISSQDVILEVDIEPFERAAEVARDAAAAIRALAWRFPDPNPMPYFTLFPRLVRLGRGIVDAWWRLVSAVEGPHRR